MQQSDVLKELEAGPQTAARSTRPRKEPDLGGSSAGAFSTAASGEVARGFLRVLVRLVIAAAAACKTRGRCVQISENPSAHEELLHTQQGGEGALSRVQQADRLFARASILASRLWATGPRRCLHRHERFRRLPFCHKHSFIVFIAAEKAGVPHLGEQYSKEALQRLGCGP